MYKHFSTISAVVVTTFLLVACNKATKTENSALPNIVDSDVTTNVKVALMNDTILKAFDINVITTKGDVRLLGIVDTQSQIDSAIKFAQEAKGTHAIHDELTLTQ